jgi:hypothetical protein
VAMDQNGGVVHRSTMDRAAARVVRLARGASAGGFGLGSSLWKHQNIEGNRWSLTTVIEDGRVAWLGRVVTNSSGDLMSSMGRRFGGWTRGFKCGFGHGGGGARWSNVL